MAIKFEPKDDRTPKRAVPPKPRPKPSVEELQRAVDGDISPSGKIAIKIRVDADVLAAWRATGKGYQSRMNDALRAAILAD